VLEVLTLKDASLVRFVTTTQGWAELARNHICVPNKWPFMVVELLVGHDGAILMSTAVGIPKTSVKALHYQGLYYYELDELPQTVVNAVIAHFKNVYKELLKRVDALTPKSPKPRLILVKQ
jgi:hypothetical protein